MKNKIELRPVKLDLNYAKKWNERREDFYNLYINGEKKSESLYRIGGFGANLDDEYFLILKYSEAFYGDDITTNKKNKKHLESHWCILDKKGHEKALFDSFKSPCLHGCIYSLGNKYYNIETGEIYCDSYKTVSSEKYLFLENRYDEDKEKRGVLKIDKKDGTFEIFK